jgi:hypothetical protein
VQVHSERYQVARHGGYETRISQQAGKLLAQMDLDRLGGEAVEGPNWR